jgi:fluoride exporter
MRELWLVALGGSCGAVARYAVGLTAARLWGVGFPWGTLLVNVVGCFLMGLVLELLLGLETRGAAAPIPVLPWQASLWRHGVAIGFLGGLTTFSSFGADTVRQFAGGQPAVALTNIAANVLLSLAAVWLGIVVMRGVAN